MWSKHVDINPGDRGAKCGGKMKPMHVIRGRANASIKYKCMKCGTEKKVRAAEQDYASGILDELAA